MVRRTGLVIGAGAIATLMFSAGANAQQASYPPDAPPPGYDDQSGGDPGGYDRAPPSGYRTAPPPQGYGDAPPDGGYVGASPQNGYGAAPPPPGAYGNGYDGQPPAEYQGQPPSDYRDEPAPPPPPGYDGSRPPPPPPGYQPPPDAAAQAQRDQAYAGYAQQWSQANCVRAHADTGGGALLGGAVGALLGAGVAGRHDRGAGALLGAGVGAVGGAAVAANSPGGATSPGCPPGYVVRADAPHRHRPGPNRRMAAPGWYQPWVFYGGAWTYRPYPYHVWYYSHYGWGRGYGRRGYYGGYRRRW